MSVPHPDQLRPHPFDLVFGSSAEPTFEGIQAALDRSGQDPLNRDQFLMLREVIELVRRLRPDEGLGEGIDQLAALVHHTCLFWSAGRSTASISWEQLNHLLHDDQRDRSEPPSTFYAQLPLRRVWAQPVPGEPQEPLDGCFISPTGDESSIRVLGIFGLHRDRAGFSVVEVSGRRPQLLTRPARAPLFASTLPGGAAAGLHSIAGEEELLELGWRLLVAGPASVSLLQAPSS